MFGFGKPKPPREHVPSPDDGWMEMVNSMDDRYLPIGIVDFTNNGRIDSRLLVCHTHFNLDEDNSSLVIYRPELLLYVPTNITDLNELIDFHLCPDEQKMLDSKKHPDYHFAASKKEPGSYHIECCGEFSSDWMVLGAEGIDHGRFAGYEPLTDNPQLSLGACNMLRPAVLDWKELQKLVKNLTDVGGLGEGSGRMEFSVNNSLLSPSFGYAVWALADKQTDANKRDAYGANDKMDGKYELSYRLFSFYDCAEIANTEKNAEMVAKEISGTYILGVMDETRDNVLLTLDLVAEPCVGGGIDLSKSRLVMSDVLPTGAPITGRYFLANDSNGATHPVCEHSSVSATMIQHLPVLPRTVGVSGRTLEAMAAVSTCMNGCSGSIVSVDNAWLTHRLLVAGTARVPDNAEHVPVCHMGVNPCIQLAVDRNAERESVNYR